MECCRQMEQYFKGERKEFDLKLDWSGESDFQQKVWAELIKIPYGKTVSYADIAERIGNRAPFVQLALQIAITPSPLWSPATGLSVKPRVTRLFLWFGH